jgi:hypothetical protein
MNQIKKTAVWIFIIGMALTMNTGCTAGPETKSDNSYKTEKKHEGSSGY